jgi:hypothetical protein
MRYWIQTDDAGRIVSHGTSPVDLEADALEHLPGAVVIEDSPGDATHYMQGRLLKQPASPGDGYVFSDAAFAWVFDPAAASSTARARRAGLLAACDWTQLPDVPAATSSAWAAYRQALRDITEQPGYPENIIWPIAPQ